MTENLGLHKLGIEGKSKYCWRHKAINWHLITYCIQLYLSRFDPISGKKKCFPFLYSWFYFQVLEKLNTYHTLAFRAYCHLFCDIFQIWGTRIFGLDLFSVVVSVKFFQSNKSLHWDPDQTKSNQVRKRSGLMDAKAPGWPFSTHPLHWRKTGKPWRMKRRTGKITCSFSGGGSLLPVGGVTVWWAFSEVEVVMRQLPGEGTWNGTFYQIF